MWWWVIEQQTAVPSVAAAVVLLREKLQRQLAGRGCQGAAEVEVATDPESCETVEV